MIEAAKQKKEIVEAQDLVKQSHEDLVQKKSVEELEYKAIMCKESWSYTFKFRPGAPFTKTWTFRNTSAIVIPHEVKLRWVKGDKGIHIE